MKLYFSALRNRRVDEESCCVDACRPGDHSCIGGGKRMNLNNRSIAMAVLALGLAAGLAKAEVLTTTFQMPFKVTVFNPATSELVDLVGQIHIVALVTINPCLMPGPDTPIALHVNLDGVKGTGRSTRLSYTMTGAADFSAMFDVPGILRHGFSFMLNPRGVDPPSPIFLMVNAAFDTDGTMIGATVDGNPT